MIEHPTPQADPRRLRFHYRGRTPDDHTVPFESLVRAIGEIQKVIYLIAKSQRGNAIGRRVRPSLDDRLSFGLVCEAAEEGGFVMPTLVGREEQQSFLDDPQFDPRAHVGQQFVSLTKAISAHDATAFQEVMPDERFRAPILSSLKRLHSNQTNGNSFTIEDEFGEPLLDSAGLHEALNRIELALHDRNQSDSDASEYGYLTGQLVRMSFDRRSFRLLTDDGVSVDGEYDDALEPTLLDHPRDLVQVHGITEYDPSGRPRTISDVDEICEVDEAPIRLERFFADGTEIKVQKPIQYEVEFDRQEHYYKLSGDFGIKCYGETRVELEEILAETLEMYWYEYALEDPANLTDSAALIRRMMLELVEGDSYGA